MPDTSQQFFEQIYLRSADPWDFAASDYEQQRYSSVVRALGNGRYARAFEPGCSIGVLTEKLANHCDLVEAMEISPTAVARARERCSGLTNVRITQGSLPEAIPAGTFDLIAFCEIGYYFDSSSLTDIAGTLFNRLNQGGVFLAEHWLGVSKDHVLSGDRVHELLASVGGRPNGNGERFEGFRMDRWTRA